MPEPEKSLIEQPRMSFLLTAASPDATIQHEFTPGFTAIITNFIMCQIYFYWTPFAHHTALLIVVAKPNCAGNPVSSIDSAGETIARVQIIYIRRREMHLQHDQHNHQIIQIYCPLEGTPKSLQPSYQDKQQDRHSHQPSH